jgi:hypothetical protein
MTCAARLHVRSIALLAAQVTQSSSREQHRPVRAQQAPLLLMCTATTRGAGMTKEAAYVCIGETLLYVISPEWAGRWYSNGRKALVADPLHLVPALHLAACHYSTAAPILQFSFRLAMTNVRGTACQTHSGTRATSCCGYVLPPSHVATGYQHRLRVKQKLNVLLVSRSSTMLSAKPTTTLASQSASASSELAPSSVREPGSECVRQRIQSSGGDEALSTWDSAVTELSSAGLDIAPDPESAQELLEKAFGWRGQGFWRGSKVTSWLLVFLVLMQCS